MAKTKFKKNLIIEIAVILVLFSCIIAVSSADIYISTVSDLNHLQSMVDSDSAGSNLIFDSLIPDFLNYFTLTISTLINVFVAPEHGLKGLFLLQNMNNESIFTINANNVNITRLNFNFIKNSSLTGETAAIIINGNNTTINNTINSNNSSAIIAHGSYNNISDNNISVVGTGSVLNKSYSGVNLLDQASNNTVSNNNINTDGSYSEGVSISAALITL